MIRREESTWQNWWDSEMEAIERDAIKELLKSLACFPLVCAVAWVILALF